MREYRAKESHNMSGYRFRKGTFLFFLISVLLSSVGAASVPTVASFKINNGSATTVNPTVTLPNVCAATSGTILAGYMASESSDFTSATWKSYASVPMFTLSSGGGEKTVYFKVKNSAGEESAVVSDTIARAGSDLTLVAWGSDAYGRCVIPGSSGDFVAISTGEKHNLGLKTDGSIVAWGDNSFGQTTVPSPNSGFVEVVARAYASLGLKADGSIVAWGDNDYGQCSVPLPNRDFVAIAEGGSHSLGLKADGSLVAWGFNRFDQCTLPSPNSGFVAIAAGANHNLGLKADGSIVAWGYNYFGQTMVPAPNRGFVAISAGGHFSLGLKSDGSIVAWGNNEKGQCTIPSPNSGFVAIKGGNYFTLGLKADGSIVAWGDNAVGQATIPAPNRDFVALAAGGAHSLALKSQTPPLGPPVVSSFKINNGAATTVNPTVTLPNVCAGATASSHFYMVSESSDFTSATWKSYASVPMFTLSSGGGEKTVYFKVKNSVGEESVAVCDTIRLDSPGAVVAWGSNYNWDGSVYTGQCNIPLPNRDYVAVAAGWGHSAALKVDGSIVVWGYNQFGQCNVPAPNRDFVAVAAVDYQTLGLKSDGSIVVWGYNNSGGQSAVPAPNRDYVAISAVRGHTLALKSDGSVVAWGGNTSGQCNVPLPNTGFVAVSAGFRHSLALKADGSVVAWGADQDYYNPQYTGLCVVPAPNSGFKAISAGGGLHNLGLKSDGSVVAWGSDYDWLGQYIGACAVPAPNSGFAAVSGGNYHSLGLKSNGSIAAWGKNNSGECNVPSPNSGFTAIAGGGNHSLALASRVYPQVVAVPDPANGGTVSKFPNQVFYQPGTTVTLLATPAPGWVFAGWLEGDITVSINSVYMYTVGGLDKTFTARFVAAPSDLYSLTLVADPVNGGTVSKTPDFPAYVPGTSVTLQAIPAAGWAFSGWWDGNTTVSTDAVFLYSRPAVNKVLTAHFKFDSAYSYILTLVSDPADGGTVTKNPELPSHVPGSWVTCAATPNYGWAFSGWWDGNTTVSTDAVFLYSMPGVNKVLTARFVPTSENSHSLTLVADPPDGGTVSKSPDHPSYTPGDPVTLCAVPAPGWSFAGWWDGTTTVSWSALYIHTVGNSNQTITARFVKVPDSYKLVVIAGSADKGTVLKDPDLPVYAPGTQVTLTAQPNIGYCFDRWTGDVSVKSKRTNPVTITMDSDQVVGVDFLPGSQPPAAAVLAFSINNGAAMTANPTVTLPNVSVETTNSIVTHYMASESADFTSATWQPYASVPMFTLSSGSGLKTVYFKVKGSLNEESAVTSDTIQLGGAGYSMVGWGDNSWGNNEFGQNSIPAPNSGFLACAAGYVHSLGLKSDGSIVAWGSNAEGQCSVPSPNSGFVAVAAGVSHNLGLKSDGSIVAWGSNECGQLVLPASNTGFVAVAAGFNHSVGLKSDGSIVVWGSNSSYQCNIPMPNSDFVAIAAGDYHTVALKSDGSIVAWGDGRCSECLVPSPNTDFVNIGAGAYHSLGVKSDGSIVAFGLNTSGQCRVPEPDKGFVAASGGVFHSLGLKSDGTLVPWGSNLYHQGDIPNSNIRFEAISAAVTRSLALVYEVGTLKVTLETPEAVAAGAQWRLADEAPGVWHNSGETITPQVGVHTVTFKNVYGWVKPADQQIDLAGTGTTGVSGLYTRSLWHLSTACSNGSIQVSPAGTHFPYGTRVTLTAQPQTGYGFDRWTGDVPTELRRTNPVTLVMDSDRTIGVDFLVGRAPAAAVLAFSINNGAIMTANPTVTLPNTSVGTTSGTELTHYMVSESADFTSATWQPYARVPMLTLSSDSGIKTVYFKVMDSLGEESAPTSDTIQLGGTGYPMVGWGDNSWGNNEFGQNNVPAPNSGFLACAAGYIHSLGLKADGSVVGWGNNDYGQYTVPAPNSGFVALAGGATHSVGLKSDSSVVVWGAGNDSSLITVPAPNSGFVAIAAGGWHCLGLKSDGSIVAWGGNYYGQCDVPEPNSGFVAVAAGMDQSLALKSDGSIVVWGGNTYNQCRIPSPNSGFVGIAGGEHFSLGLKSDGSIVGWGYNNLLQCDAPEPNTDFIALAGGIFFSIGLKSDGSIVSWGYRADGRNEMSLPNRRFTGIVATETHALALLYEVGTLTVTLGTPEAVVAGAQWRLADEAPGVWHNSGETITPQVGAHSLTFKKVYDWAKPEDQPIEITKGGYVKTTGLYTWSPWFVNTPPFITALSVTPTQPKTSDLIVPMFQVTDVEGDAIAAYRYEWVLDGMVRSTDATLSPDLTSKGQVWTLRVWAQDAQGQWSSPEAFTFTIFNSPPTQPIVQVIPQPTRPDQDLIVDVLVYSTDPDGDAVKYDFKWYKSVDRGRTWIHKVELDGSPQVSQNFINPCELWDVFYTPYEVNSQSVLQALPEEYTATSRPVDFAVARAGAFVVGKTMTAWDRSYVGENAPPEFRFDAIQTQWTTEGLKLSVNWTAVDGDGEAMQVDLSWTDLEYSGLVTVGSDLSAGQGQYSALVHPTSGKPFYLHAAVSDAKGAVTQVITRQINLTGLQVANQPASEVTEAAAVLNGSLSSTGGAETEVQVYWGRTDGGQEPLAWEHVETLGTRGEGGFSVPISGLLPGTRYLYRCVALNAQGEVWAGDVQSFDTEVPVPAGLTAVANTYQILLTWDAVTTVTGYAIERQAVGTGEAVPMVWTVGAVTEFADDSAVPGVPYAYTVRTIDALGAMSDPSDPVSATVAAEAIVPVNYKVMAKGYAMTRDLPTTGSLTFTANSGSKSGTIKIASLKRVPANAQDDPARGIYYLKDYTQVPTLAIQGDVKTLSFDVPVYSLEATGLIQAVSAHSVTFLKARAFEKIMLTATKPSDEGFYARTFIETEGSSQVPMLIKATGAVVEELVSTGKTAQPVKLLNVASKVYRSGSQTKISLGAVGSLPRVVAEVSGTVAPQSEATPSSIRGSELKAITVANGPIVADEIVGNVEKITAAGGNIRCALIQSGTNLTLLQATAKKGVGGAIGTAGWPGAMAVKAQTQGKGKNKAAITKVSGQTGISGYFYAGYTPETGQPTHSGGIGILQTKASGGVEGAVFLDPDQVKKMKVSPESPLLAINPDL
jgi:alpha-tubulin suppressor-like RCC1 family protein